MRSPITAAGLIDGTVLEPCAHYGPVISAGQDKRCGHHHQETIEGGPQVKDPRQAVLERNPTGYGPFNETRPALVLNVMG